MEDLKTLITKLEENESIKIYDYIENSLLLTITVFKEAREIFWQVIIPNLPTGYKVLPKYPINDNYNIFEIHQNEIEKNQKDLFLKHLMHMEHFISHRLTFKFPKIRELFENDLQNIKDKIFKENYCKHGYSNSINIEYIQILCGIEYKLKYLLENSGFENFLNETLGSLENKSKDLENKEKELFERAKALDFLKKHLDKILTTK
ncbi:MAG: hypothetical protein ACO25K_06375 [Candidatus Fonsibacter ubiquis]